MSQRILIVESEPHAREGLRAILAATGHEVSVAEDLVSGFVGLASGPFDVLLLDADLPPSRKVFVGVLDLLRLARMAHAGTYGILVTSCGDDLPRDLAAQGVVAVLEKPVEIHRLQKALEVVAARAAARTEASTASRP